jgi:hypothetical protein
MSPKIGDKQVRRPLPVVLKLAGSIPVTRFTTKRQVSG